MYISDALRGYAFQRKIELCMVILIIGICAKLAIMIFSGYKEISWQAHLAGLHANSKVDATLYHAVHGRWPEDDSDVLKFLESFSWQPLFSNRLEDEPSIETRIESGAFHHRLTHARGNLSTTLTLRPSIPAQELTGPIVWRCTDQMDDPEWVLFGVDRTTVDQSFIIRSIR